jgi:hypothetical protein
VVTFKRRPLYFVPNNLRYALVRRLGRTRSRSGRGDEEKEIPVSEGNRTLVVHPIAQSLYSQLQNVGSET